MSKKFSESVKSYTDVHQAFEAAGINGELTLRFATPAEAVTWASRANKYRVILRKQNAAAGRDFACAFDHLIVSRKNGEPSITLRPRGFNFRAFTPDGREVSFDQQTLTGPVATPHEMTEAQRLAEAEAEAFLADYESKKGAEE